MLKNHANMVAGDNGSVVWFNDIIEASSRTELSSVPYFMQKGPSRSAKNHLRKILVVNEGAGDSVALLGNEKLEALLKKHYFCVACIFSGTFNGVKNIR